MHEPDTLILSEMRVLVGVGSSHAVHVLVPLE